METYNIYMDEAPAAADANGDEGWEVEFRVVGQSIDDGDPENNAVLAGLDLVDLSICAMHSSKRSTTLRSWLWKRKRPRSLSRVKSSCPRFRRIGPNQSLDGRGEWYLQRAASVSAQSAGSR